MRRLIDLVLPLGMTLAWVMPLHFMPWVTWHSEVPVFAAVLLAASWAVWQAIRTNGWGAHAHLPAMAASIVALGMGAMLQAATGVIPFYGDAWIVLLYALLCGAAFMLGHGQAVRAEQIERATNALAWTLVLAALGSSVIALVQSLDVWVTSEWIVRTPTYRRSGGNLAQPNQMATLLLMGVASLAYLFECRRIGAKCAVMIGTVLVLGLATTESRTGLLAVTALAVWWFCRGYASRLRPSAIVIALGLVLLAYAAWPPLLEAFHGEAGAQAARVNTQVGLRAVVWPQLLEAVAQRPWIGWGARQTSAALTSVVHAHPVSEPYTYAHDIVLELLIAFGVPLTLIVVAGAGVWVWRRWGARNALVGWYCMALWVPLMVHAMLEFPYSYAYLLAPAMFALGLLDGMSRAELTRPIPVAVLAVILAGTCAVAAWSVRDYIEVEEDFRVARFEAGRIGTTPAEYRRPTLYLLTQFGAMLKAARVVPTPGMSPQEVASTGVAAARFPWPALQNRYALALALNGQPAAAEQELRVMLAMHGEALFRDIRLNWKTLQDEKYPQLGKLRMPRPAPVPAKQ